MAKSTGRKVPGLLVNVGALVLAVGLRCTGNDEGRVPPRDAAETDATSEEDEASTGDWDVDANTDTDGRDESAGDGENCGNNAEPACALGLQCVQESPPYCSIDYLGQCEPIPTDCSAEPVDEVCSCDGTSFSSPCEARRSGERRILVDCP